MPHTDSDRRAVSRRVARLMEAHGKHIATAESCTGGWMAKFLTDIAGSAEWFLDGFVTYSNEAKERQLDVDHHVLIHGGAVSRRTAQAMARGALAHSRADVAVAVTGIAGPDGAVPGKPVGTVWLAWAFRRGGRAGRSS